MKSHSIFFFVGLLFFLNSNASVLAFNQDINASHDVNTPAVQKHVTQALRYEKSGFYDKAIAEFNSAIKLAPKNSGLYNDRGLQYWAKRDLKKAAMDFKQALKLNPTLAKTHNNLGLLLARDMGDFDAGIPSLTKAIEINPTYVDAYQSRGMAYLYSGQSEKAIGDFSKIVEIDPKNADGYFNRSCAYAELKNYDKAWDDYYKAKSLDAKIDPGYVRELAKASGRQK